MRRRGYILGYSGEMGRNRRLVKNKKTTPAIDESMFASWPKFYLVFNFPSIPEKGHIKFKNIIGKTLYEIIVDGLKFYKLDEFGIFSIRIEYKQNNVKYIEIISISDFLPILQINISSYTLSIYPPDSTVYNDSVFEIKSLNIIEKIHKELDNIYYVH